MTGLIDLPTPPQMPYVGNGLRLMGKGFVDYFVDQTLAAPDSVMSFRFPNAFSPVPIITCASAEAALELFDDERFPRFSTPALVEVIPHGLFAAFTQDPHYSPSRRVVLPGLSGANLTHHLADLQEISRRLVARAIDRDPGNRHVDVLDLFTRAAFDTICRVGFRTSYGTLFLDQGPELLDAINQGSAGVVQKAKQLPLQTRLRFIQARKQRDALSIIWREVDAIIARRRELGPEIGTDDILARLLWNPDPETGELIAPEILRQQVITFLVAGHETTTSLMTWVSYHLSAHPEIQARVQAELDAVSGGDRSGPLSSDQLAQLDLLDRVLTETLRISPVFMAPARYAAQDESLLGKYRVPKGSVLLVLQPALHTNPRSWKNPDVFDPDRWLPENVGDIVPGSYAPFGGGTRSCIGRGFARLEALTFLSSLLREVTFSLDGVYSLAKELTTFSLHPKHLTTLTITPRAAVSTTANIAVAQPVSATSSQVCPHPSGATTTAATVASAPTLPAGTSGTLTVAYGTDGGTCHDFARRIASDATRNGFDTTVVTLDSIADQLPLESPLVVAVSSYNGLPPGNARRFMTTIKADGADLSTMRTAVFGVGDPAWQSTYQFIPIDTERLLGQAGATRLVERAVIDVSRDIESGYVAWTTALWASLGVSMPAAEATGPGFSVVELHDPSLDLATSGLANMEVRVSRELNRVTGVDPSSRSTRHVEFELPAGVTYETGDHLVVMPYNSTTTVDRALYILGVDASTRLEISTSDPHGSWLPTGVAVVARHLFAAFIDFGQPITRRRMRILAGALTGDAASRVSALAELPDDDYDRQIITKRMTLLDLLTELAQAPLPLPVALSLLSPLQRRRYSISSSPLADPTRVSVTVGVVEGPAHSGQGTFRGVTSTHLAHLEPVQVVMANIVASNNFAPPEDASVPLIMVGAGSGLAPFRGFIQHRAAQQAAGQTLAPAILFAGCRRSDHDRIYGEEFDAYEAAGVVRVEWAYSREPATAAGVGSSEWNWAASSSGTVSKTYVQDLITRNREELLERFAQGAVMYICGDANRMPAAVRKSLGEELVTELRANGQYHEDVWSSAGIR